MSSHTISPGGFALIQQFEGFQSEPVQLPDGNWVVGHGHIRAGAPGADVERAEARSLLALDLAPIERSVNENVKAEITQQQFDALASFAFSLGLDVFEHSDVLRKVNAGQFFAAGCAMDAWRKSDASGEAEIIDTLVRRRAAEKALFLADVSVDASPSVFMRAKLDHAAAILGAPIAFARAPQVGSTPVVQPKPAPAERLTEILKSEPTAELLLTEVATPEQIAEHELLTAHAKPVVRRTEIGVVSGSEANPFLRYARIDRLPPRWRSIEAIGLGSLLLFGAGLVILGASTLIGARMDSVDVMGAVALIAPGLAAIGLAGFGLWKTPGRAPAPAAA